MNDENKQAGKFGDTEISALAATGSILVFMAIYWFAQIQSVRELLELAYG